jgi:predicted nucleotidyltransferase
LDSRGNMGRTVNELTPEELKGYNPGRTLEAYQTDTRTAERKSLAWKMARIASKILKEKYGAKKVLLFGSLANDKRFTPWSDIDLSVSGLPPQSYYRAAGEIMDLGLAKGIKIDVLDKADCPPRMKKRISTEGIEL